MSSNDDQQFCLRWNNFQAYLTSQFEVLRDEEDFVDVTLACEGQRLGAHKVVLSACSPFFKELFKTNPCPHPIIFMRDVEARHVVSLLEFMYAGEVNIAQTNLAGFLKTAESLQIRGLTDALNNEKGEVDRSYPESQTPNQTELVALNSPTNRPAVLKLQKSQPQKQRSPTPDNPHEDNPVVSTPPPCKRACKTDEADADCSIISQQDSKINPFALQPNNKALHTEIDISADLIEPKLELPDYSEDETNQENSHEFIDSSDAHNSFLTGGMEIIPGTSGVGDMSQESQQAWDNRKLHSLDPRPCPVCGRVYSNLSNLRQHMRLIHNPTNVQCPVCAKSFKTTLYLKRHLVSCRVHHGKPVTEIKQPQQGQNPQPPPTQQPLLQEQLSLQPSSYFCRNDNREIGAPAQSCYAQSDSTNRFTNSFELRADVVNDNIIV